MAGILVNAAGPWAADILGHVAGLNATARVRMVKGSHVATRRLYGHDRCYIFQNSHGRMCFAIPCQDEYTLNGTTDEEFEGDPSQTTISEAEREYLCRAVRGYVKQALTTADVVGSSAGVRPLYDQGATRAQEAARDYVPNLDAPDGKAPMLSVFGGKITTYRCLAEAALARLSPYLPGLCPAWTAKAPLPGDDVPWNGAPTIATNLVRRDLFLAPGLARRFVRYYGARSASMLGAARGAADLGRDFGAGLTEREVAWQMREEWVREPADVLRRRTKLGLRIGAEGQAALAALMASQRGYLAEAAE